MQNNRIFISYSFNDRPFVERLISSLPEFEFLGTDVAPGDNIVDHIADAIKQSAAMIYVLSDSSQNSNWMQTELSIALGKSANDGYKIFPVLISGSPDNAAFLRSRLFIDFRNENNFGSSLNLLRKSLLSLSDDSALASPRMYDERLFRQEIEMNKALLELKYRSLLETQSKRSRHSSFMVAISIVAGTLAAFASVLLTRKTIEVEHSFVVILSTVTATITLAAAAFSSYFVVRSTRDEISSAHADLDRRLKDFGEQIKRVTDA